MDECVWIKPERLGRKLHHRGKEAGAGHVRLLCEPRLESRRYTFCLWHSADPGRMLHHTFALGDSELAKQEETLARRGGDPIGIAAAGIQKRGLGGPGGLLCQIDQLILDLERTQGLEFSQGKFVSHDLLL
jgi:hypothetical protein